MHRENGKIKLGKIPYPMLVIRVGERKVLLINDAWGGGRGGKRARAIVDCKKGCS